MKVRHPGGRRLLYTLLGGLLAFAAGAALAMALLPEWSTGELPAKRQLRAQYRRLADRAGFRLAPGEPQVSLVAASPAREVGPRGPEAQLSALRVRVRHRVGSPDKARSATLEISFNRHGRPARISWSDFTAPLMQRPDRVLFDRLSASLPPLLLAPGESIGRSAEGRERTLGVWRTLDLVGSSPGQHLRISIKPPFELAVARRPGRLTGTSGSIEETTAEILIHLLIYISLALAVAGIFLSLLLRGRIDLTNGAVLALVTLLSANLLQAFDLQATAWITAVTVFFAAPGRALWVFLVWSAGESLLRSLRPDFTTSLDTLRLGRLGPRGGRGLLLGVSYGGVLAGLQLGLYVLAAVLPGVRPAAPSLELPVFDFSSSPVGSGITQAAVVALAFALGLRFLPDRWALPAAALLAGAVLTPIRLYPYPVELAVNAAFAAVLVWVCRRYGLTALLTAAIVSLLLPAALFSALHLSWLPGTFGLTVGITGALLLFGFVGVSRSEEAEVGRLPMPAFMRRLAEERRLNHEVDLLARMQVGLLPQEMPRIEGYEIAARSVLASEAGGDLYDFLRDDAGHLWIAAGDVAGHGYSCAVAQAMVKAGLLSLIEPGESPGEVLRQLDRVLRGVSSDHSFTSLALVRLETASGEALLANAGHPYPLVFAGGRIAEVDLPGLPLGQGPVRPYADRTFQLSPGAVLLLCSDGLFEALDSYGNAYGFDRAREVLQVMGHRPAVEIVDALLNDCRRHLDAESAPDDVTVVVVRRV